MNEGLSRLIAGLLMQAKGGEDLSSGINRVRTVIKKVIEGENTILGKLHALVESFREVIPEEKQRYHAAIKALSATAKLSRQEIVTAVNNQLEELKILERIMISVLPHAPGELKAMEAKLQEMRNEISSLREKTARLEKKEKEIADSMAGREKDTSVLEKAIREVFTDIRAEITSIKKKVEELPAESAAQQPIPDTVTVKTDFPGKEKQSSGEKSITDQISSHIGTKPQKTCPMCGGQMSFSATRELWQCFPCAYEELEKDEAQRGNKEPSAQSIFPEPGEQTNAPAPSAQTIFPEPTPASELKQNGEKSEQRTTPEPAPASDQKQKCPMCGGQMDYYIADRKWQCYSCGFEYNKDEGQSKSEENRDHSNALLSIPASEPLFDHSSTIRPSPGFLEPKKVSPFSQGLPAIKKKTCPSCGMKMYWYGSERRWQCHDCGYERRI